MTAMSAASGRIGLDYLAHLILSSTSQVIGLVAVIVVKLERFEKSGGDRNQSEPGCATRRTAVARPFALWLCDRMLHVSYSSKVAG